MREELGQALRDRDSAVALARKAQMQSSELERRVAELGESSKELVALKIEHEKLVRASGQVQEEKNVTMKALERLQGALDIEAVTAASLEEELMATQEVQRAAEVRAVAAEER